jgi:hypothetical protein
MVLVLVFVEATELVDDAKDEDKDGTNDEDVPIGTATATGTTAVPAESALPRGATRLATGRCACDETGAAVKVTAGEAEAETELALVLVVPAPAPALAAVATRSTLFGVV